MIAAVVACAEPVRAESSALLKYVGEEVGLCVELVNARDEIPALLASSLAVRFRQTELWTEWRQSGPYERLQHVQAAVEAVTGKPSPVFAREMFGQSVVLAVYPVNKGEPKGVLLTQAENSAVLAEALAAWNRADSCELKEHAHGGATYFKRQKLMKPADRDRPEFYIQLGDVLAISDSEEMIRLVADLGSHAQTARPITERAAFQKVHKSISGDAAAWAYFNPQAWHGVVQHLSTDDAFGKIWTRCEAVVAQVSLQDGATIEIAFHYDGSGVPAEWSDFVSSTQGSPGLLSHVPHNAFAVAAGRWSPAGVDDWIVPYLSEHERAEWKTSRRVLNGLLLGQDVFDDVLPALGPDWVGYLVPRVDSGKRLPFDGLFAIALTSTAEHVESPGDFSVARGLKNALLTGFNLLAAFRNSRSADLSAHVEVHESGGNLQVSISGFGGVEPTFAITERNLILASTPRLVDEFRERWPVNGNAAQAAEGKGSPSAWWEGRLPEGVNQLVFVDMGVLRDLLAGGGWPFDSGDEAARRRLNDLLSPADMVFLGASADGHRVRFVLGCRVNEETVEQ